VLVRASERDSTEPSGLPELSIFMVFLSLATLAKSCLWLMRLSAGL